jgi:hydroxyethylthiazole kinase-like uncharacterized protein yjeF
MRKKNIIITARQAREADDYTINTLGIPGILLMERAGRAVALEAVNLAHKLRGGFPKAKIAVFCGKGNNGGDGLVCARYLVSAGMSVTIYLINDNFLRFSERPIDAQWFCYRKTPYSKISQKNHIKQLKKTFMADIIIDAIFGIGFHGIPAGIYKDSIEFINSRHSPVISIDVPSGLDATTGIAKGSVVSADITTTFGFEKKGFYKKQGLFSCGQVKIIDIGLMLKGA